MCRSIKKLYRNSNRIKDDEFYEAALQFVRKISGIRKPSKIHREAFEGSVFKIAKEIKKLINDLENLDEKRSI